MAPRQTAASIAFLSAQLEAEDRKAANVGSAANKTAATGTSEEARQHVLARLKRLQNTIIATRLHPKKAAELRHVDPNTSFMQDMLGEKKFDALPGTEPAGDQEPGPDGDSSRRKPQ